MILKSKSFNKLLFLSGIVLLLVGGALYINGPKRYLNYENEEIASFYTSINGYEKKEIYRFTPGNFSYYIENSTCYARFHTASLSEAEVTLHILNDSQFDLWKEKQLWQDTLLSKNMSNNEAISFNLLEKTRHHFILENRLNTKISSVFSLNRSGFFLRFDYSGFIYYILMIGAGVLLCLFFGAKSLKNLNNSLLKFENKFHKKNTRKWSEEEKAYKLKHYKTMIQIVKMLVSAIAVMLFVSILLMLAGISEAIAAPGEFYRPEFIWLVYDYAIRTVLFVAFQTLLILAATIVTLLVINPLITAIVEEKILCRIGIKYQTKRKFLFDKFMYKATLGKVKSWPVLSILLIPLLFLAIASQLGLLGTTFKIYSFVVYMFILGTLVGYIVSTSYHEAYISLKIGKYAAKRYAKADAFNYTISIPVILIIILFSVLLSTSSSMVTFLNETLFSPVLMLGAKSLTQFIEPLDAQILSSTVVGIIGCFILLGVLVFVLFPIVYRKGRKGITVALITFTLVYLTEIIFSIFLDMTATIFQPLAIISPLIVSMISWIVQGKYQRTVEKIAKVKRA